MKASKKHFILIVFLFACLTSSSVKAFDFLEVTGPHRLSFGPQVYELKRERRGGTHQRGLLYGMHFCYERVRTNGLYFAGDISYGTGVMTGKSSSGSALKSHMSEWEAEGRLGWAVGFCVLKPFMITPFVGYGTYRGCNDFNPPSPLLLTFRDKYDFGSVGLRTFVLIKPSLTFGINYTARWTLNPHEKVSGDLESLDETMVFNEHWNYLVELPLRYHFGWRDVCWEAQLVPFWESRHYGGMESHPQDFISTRYFLYGLRFLLGIRY